MFAGKIKIKAKFFVKVKAIMEMPLAEEVKDLVIMNDFSFEYILNSFVIDTSREFGYGWRTEGESSAI